MVNFLVRWGVKSLAVWSLPYIFGPHMISVADVTTAIIAAAVLTIVNLFVRPLVKLVTLPINLMTLGLFTFVINAAMFWLTTLFVPGFTVNGFVPALLGAVVVSILTGVMNALLGTK